MRVFVTGATGFIGTAIVKELLSAGHQVLGLARSDESAKKLTDAGAEVQLGSLEDLNSLTSGATTCDGIIHAGFIHDFSDFKKSCDIDLKAVQTLAAAIKGTDKPLVLTSGTALVNHGHIATENDDSNLSVEQFPRVATEHEVKALAKSGIKAMIVRLSPSVHGDTDFHGFIPTIINIARDKGESAYIADGQNRWTGVHVLDAANLFRLALEKGSAGASYHGVADEGITIKEIAEVIGKQLNFPVVSKSKEEAAAHFGWIAHFFAIDCPATSDITKQDLGWNPTHPGLIADMENGSYFKN